VNTVCSPVLSQARQKGKEKAIKQQVEKDQKGRGWGEKRIHKVRKEVKPKEDHLQGRL